MTSREARKMLKEFGGIEVRQRGSHLVVRLGRLQSVIPVHPGKDLKPGTWHKIQRLWRDLEDDTS